MEAREKAAIGRGVVLSIHRHDPRPRIIPRFAFVLVVLACSAGSGGKLTVKLSKTINVESISLEHAPRELLLNKGISAPKHFTVYGECGETP